MTKKNKSGKYVERELDDVTIPDCVRFEVGRDPEDGETITVMTFISDDGSDAISLGFTIEQVHMLREGLNKAMGVMTAIDKNDGYIIVD